MTMHKERIPSYITDGKFILVDRKPVPERDLFKWAEWMEHSNRIVKQETIMEGDVPVLVSTVFLGLNSDLFVNTRWPRGIFETMIFGGKHSEYQTRCSTWEQAEEMHRKAVELVVSSS